MRWPPSRAPGERTEAGRRAEALAAEFLEGKGMEILARNHRARRGEVDLVCRDGAVLCFVEVRSREAGAPMTPEESIDRRKALRVVAAATDWAARHGGLERPIRFDVVAIELGRGAPVIRHHRNAFDADGGTP
ncbi:MAG: YraN family protein [Anaeromyxobacter sp.]